MCSTNWQTVLLLVGCRSEQRGEPLHFPEYLTQPEKLDLSLPEGRTPQWESHKEEHEKSKRDTKQSTATRTTAGETSPVELALIVVPPQSQNPPEPLLGQYNKQHQEKALQLEGAIKISGTFKKTDEVHENAGGGNPQPWPQMSEPHQTRSVDLTSPTFASQGPVDWPITMARQTPTNTSRSTSERRYVEASAIKFRNLKI